MNYFDIFRINYDDLRMIAAHPEAIRTEVRPSGSGYIGEIILAETHPDRENPVLFFHENTFESEQEALDDLNQIIAAIIKAFENARDSEAIRKSE